MTSVDSGEAASTTSRPATESRAPRHWRLRRNGRKMNPYWPLAVGEVVLAIALAMTLPGIEHRYRLSDGLSYDASTAQATLAAIASGMFTLTGFVLTAVTLIVQTVQGQSSRLLQSLNRTDKKPMLFGMFVATFMFALIVLSDVNAGDVPSLSVSVALIMVLVCVALFLRLLVTLRQALTVCGLTWTIGQELRAIIDELYPLPFSAAGPGRRLDDVTPAWSIRHAGAPGVFESFDEPAAVRLAVRASATIRFIPAIGEFVVTGTVIAVGSGQPPPYRRLRRLVRVRPERTLEQDPAYGIRILADIAIRALSPAVNDPTSAVQALDQIADILHRLAGRSLGDGSLHDRSGRVVVCYAAPTWDSYLDLAVDEVTRYGAHSTQVTRRLRVMLESLLTEAPAQRRPPIAAKLAALSGP